MYNHYKISLLILLNILLIQYINAQNLICGFQKFPFITEQNNNHIKTIDFEIRDFLNHNRNIKYRQDIVIPVVFHIVYSTIEENIPNEKITEQLEILNLAFEAKNTDINKVPNIFMDRIPHQKISFCIAEYNDSIESAPAIIRVKTKVKQIGIKKELYSTNLGGSTAWNPDKYLNIWIADTGKNVKGFGTFPLEVPKEMQGVVVNPHYFGKNETRRYNLGKTLIHEIGHYFGLKHLWGDQIGCDFDDEIDDTPTQYKFHYGCPIYPQISCNSEDMFMNYMDYVDDDCMYMFTKGQMNRMISTILLYRKDLLSFNGNCYNNKLSNEKLDINIYPNPAKNHIQFQTDRNLILNIDIYLYDSLGKKVLHKKTTLYNKMKFNIANIASGIYFLKIGNVCKKLVIIK